MPYLPAHLRGNSGGSRRGASSLYSLAPAAAAAAAEEEDDGGFLGIDLPDLGVTTLFKEIGAAVPALGQMVLPDWGPLPDGGPGWAEFGKGTLASLAGTSKTLDPVSLLSGGRLSNPLNDWATEQPERWWGPEYEAKDFGEKAAERGILPALVEDVGNAALVAGGATAALKAGSAGARAGGASTTAARLARAAESQGLGILEHPYRTTASKLREGLTKPAQESLLRSYGVDAPPASEVAGVVDVPNFDGAMESVRNAPASTDSGGFGPVYDQMLPQEPGVQYLPDEDGGVLGLRGDDGALQGYLQHTAGDAGAIGMFENTSGVPGVGQQLLDAAEAQGLDVPALLANSDFTDAGRASALKWLGNKATQTAAAVADDVAEAAPPAAAGPPPSALTRLLGGVENRLQAMDARKVARERTRIASTERAIAGRSRAVQLSVKAARDHLIQRAAENGERMSRRVASEIVGDEIYSRLSGVKSYEGTVPDADLVRIGIRQTVIPEQFRSPELSAILDEATEAWRSESAKTREILTQGRKGIEGLDGLGAEDASLPALTKRQKRTLKEADRRIERAHSEKVQRQINKERLARVREIITSQDKLGRIAEEARRLDEIEGQALRDFEHARTWTPQSFRTPEALAKSVEAIHASTIEHGGATFDPHTGKFLVPGESPGYAVAVVPGTALSVPLDQLTPQHIEQVIRQFQDVYQHPNTTIGTWVDDKGIVHIDPGQVMADLDDAILTGSIRGQEAIYDLAADRSWDLPLKDRPDIAANFLTKNGRATRGYRTIANKTREVAARSEITPDDVNLILAQQARLATTLFERGKIARPDDFFGKVLKDVRFGKGASKVEGALRQITLEQKLDTPEARAALMKDVQGLLGDMSKARGWYHESHAAVEAAFRNSPDVTLLDGTKINPADLMYQLIAVTSVQQAPRDNFRMAASALRQAWDMPSNKDLNFKGMTADMKKVTAGKMTLEDFLAKHELAGPAGAKKLAPVGQVRAGQTMLTQILMGNTIDKWSHETLTRFNEAFDYGPADLPRDKALAWIRENYPEVIDEIGEEQAIAEYYGRKAKAKIRLFYDNLRDPENSLGVTMDFRMEQLFGQQMETGKAPWLVYSERVREMARELSEQTGEKWLPHELQAVLWVYVKNKANQVRSNHFRAYANDVAEQINRHEVITDANDPILSWLDETLEPYAQAYPIGTEPAVNPQTRNLRMLSETGEAYTEDVTVRPGFGNLMAQKDGVPSIVVTTARKKLDWLKVRDEINGHLATGNVDEAHRMLTKYESGILTKDSLHGGIFDGSDGGSFWDIFQDDRFHSAKFVEAFDSIRGELQYGLGNLPEGLMQSFQEKILGEFVPMADEAAGVIRIFESGNYATLVHENGHLLRRLLSDAEMSAVEREYGVRGGKWDVPAEERFANDFLQWQRGGNAPKGLQTSFARVREVMLQMWDMVKGTFLRRQVPDSVANVFDEWLDPVERPMEFTGLPDLTETGTLPQRANMNPKLPQPPAGNRDFYLSGRSNEAALARLEQTAARRRALEANKANIEKHIAELRRVLDENETPSQIAQRNDLIVGQGLRNRVRGQLGEPSLANTPARWQPLWDATLRIAKDAETNPEMAKILQGLPATLQEIQQKAITEGFDPTHVRDFTPTQVRRLVHGSMRLGLGREGLAHEVAAGTRKNRTMTLARKGAADRSFDALLAATVEATNEANTNAVISWVEDSVARKLPEGAKIPEGWEPWDPAKTYLLTGTELTPDQTSRVATTLGEQTIVPKAVIDTLNRFSKDYDHTAFRAISKVTSPWRTLVLTLSPGWYVRNFVGNVIMASAEGVRLRDWQAAWKSFRTKDLSGRFADLPQIQGSGSLATEATGYTDPSLIPSAGRRELVQEGGQVRGNASWAQRKLLRVNEVVDEFARAAVYHKSLNKMNMTPNEAWKRASEAMVDYSALSPFEKQAVRSVIPFYAWQKGILKVTMNQVIDHPARIAVLMQLGQLQEDYISDLFGLPEGAIPDQYNQMIGNRNFRSYNPFADPVEILTPEGIMRSMNPFIELGIRKGLGAPEFYSGDQRLGYWGTPQQDVNVSSELTNLLTRSPGGRLLGGPVQDANATGAVQQGLGLNEQDIDVLRARFQKSNKTING